MDNDLQRKFNALPQDLKEAVNSVDFAKSLQEIGKTSGLHLDQLDQLFQEVGYVLLGMTHPNEFGGKIGSLFNLPEVAKNSLVKEVDEKIFKPIRASLMTLYSKPVSSANPPKADWRGEVIPHETDYNNMSREKILSEIENPVKITPLKEDPLAKRKVETSDPNLYLSDRNEMIQKMNLIPLNNTLESIAPAKKSLAEEAVLIAQKKVADYKNTPPIKPNPTPIILQKSPPTAPTIPQTVIANSPLEKLTNVVRVPRENISITPPKLSANNPSTRSGDPYREIV